MCVLDLWMLCIFIERSFESLMCWLDLCLSSLLVAFISMCFSHLWKTPSLQAWQLLDKSSTDSLLSKILFKVSILLLLILSPLFTFGSVMRRPERTSWRTFRNMAFIRNITSFCQILPTLLSSKSFGLRVGHLYLRDPWGVPSCIYSSFAPIYTVSKPLYLSLPRHSEVQYRSYLGFYIRGTTCPEGIAS